MRVHRELGNGFLEAVYQEALALEFDLSELPYRAQVRLPLSYRGQALATYYVADFLCFECVLVELKATSGLTSADDAQLINYLKSTGHRIGLLLNFGTPSVQHRRLVF